MRFYIDKSFFYCFFLHKTATTFTIQIWVAHYKTLITNKSCNIHKISKICRIYDGILRFFIKKHLNVIAHECTCEEHQNSAILCTSLLLLFFFKFIYLFLLKYLFLIFVILQTQKIFTFIREDYSTNITNYYILILQKEI